MYFFRAKQSSVNYSSRSLGNYSWCQPLAKSPTGPIILRFTLACSFQDRPVVFHIPLSLTIIAGVWHIPLSGSCDFLSSMESLHTSVYGHSSSKCSWVNAWKPQGHSLFTVLLALDGASGGLFSFYSCYARLPTLILSKYLLFSLYRVFLQYATALLVVCSLDAM